MKDEGSREKTVEYLANILDTYGTLTTYPLSTDMIRDIVGLLKAQDEMIRDLKERLRLLEHGDQDAMQSGLMPAT